MPGLLDLWEALKEDLASGRDAFVRNMQRASGGGILSEGETDTSARGSAGINLGELITTGSMPGGLLGAPAGAIGSGATRRAASKVGEQKVKDRLLRDIRDPADLEGVVLGKTPPPAPAAPTVVPSKTSAGGMTVVDPVRQEFMGIYDRPDVVAAEAAARTANKDWGASASMPEYQTLAPWWRDRIAGQLGMEAVPAQAVTWGLFAPRTGVTTPVGAPKLELIAQQIGETARRFGISPEEARDRWIRAQAILGAPKQLSLLD